MLTKVLVIDDDKEMTDLLKLVLEPNSFEVLVSNSGAEGIKIAQKTSPDVIILDLFMPEIDGWTVCKEIRKTSTVPILVLSAMNKPGTVARALDEGADDYLTKPMTTSVLVAHIRKLARRARAEQEATRTQLGLRL